MRQSQISVSISAVFLSFSMLSASCSNSNFADASAGKSQAKVAATTDAASKSGASDAATANSAAGNEAQDPTTAGGNTTLAIEGSPFVGDFETPSSNDATTPGCTLPPEVQKAMSAFVESKPAAGLALTGWGGGGGAISQSQLGLKNLDLNSCEWFQKAKQDTVARYMIVLTKGGQSYAQPFKLAANAITYAACITSAATASLSAGGPVSCSFMPRS